MAKGDRNWGWPGFFRAFTVLCAIMLLLAHRYLDLTAPRTCRKWRCIHQ